MFRFSQTEEELHMKLKGRRGDAPAFLREMQVEAEGALMKLEADLRLHAKEKM